jgi:hypothetical protein
MCAAHEPAAGTGGKPTYTYNWLGLQRYTIAAKEAVPAGKATVRFEFAYDGGGIGKGGMAVTGCGDDVDEGADCVFANGLVARR